MKRYAIVRVDDAEEGIKWLDILDEIVKKRKIIIDYGDTKEQLVLKVSQALKMAYEERTGNYGYSLKFYEPMAKFIVEFLGVE